MESVNNVVNCCITKVSESIIYPGTELELWEMDSDRKHVADLLENMGYRKSDTIVALGLTASTPLKHWPTAYYGELVNKLREKWENIYIVLLGDKVEQGEYITEVDNVLNLCGQLTLRETSALLRHVILYIGNDTGLMHIASACGCAIVEISSFALNGDVSSGFSSSSRFSPWSKNAMIIQPLRQIDACRGGCQMPYPHCIIQVTVERVFEAANNFLQTR